MSTMAKVCGLIRNQILSGGMVDLNLWWPSYAHLPEMSREGMQQAIWDAEKERDDIAILRAREAPIEGK